ncbi:16S rRNA (guanine(966)-N(2))-methyltransferase RsmD [Denitrificimonas sp. JX-1]|uniref:Ribosomal RNA small subunit methyltransferase D n=1 Tax=Denitrificimonas halotolerans TaxID=3098930 RepID=A0ABU5GN21_9GAMM|nr:16S rRNA (guanine(966)-N(2))-methyltransferase RsmD [Denitrificimonas sp. JX-1]MDY7218364.1 16S rRNA (guanine(966)-N(2))-methyltransferase RsmD [Denitrificimonas sp. JX-1]
MAKKNTVATRGNQVRIIGGQWRSRKLNVPDAPGLRPTPDRVRETLYNWLAAYIQGARVLDAFTGSGALFLEAMSRGAATGVALDLNPEVVSNLRNNLTLLQCDTAEVLRADALQHLKQTPIKGFDIVLLDPPFHQDLLLKACQLLEEHHWLQAEAWIYTESEQAPSSLAVPSNWRLHREKHSGQVHYALWQKVT